MKQNVKLRSSTCRERKIGRILIVCLMLGLWLGATALATSPQLHHRLHKDSQSPTHECLVTFFSKGYLFGAAEGNFVLPLIPLFFGLLLIAELSHFSILEYRLSPSRAPPSNPSHLRVVG